MLNTAPQAAALWTALLLILLVVLAVIVVRHRRSLRVGYGDGGHPALQQATRTFGNAAEYVPAGIGALILLTVLRAPFPLIHVVGALLFVGRIVHAKGLSTSTGVTNGRIVGMMLTFTAYIVAAVALLLYAFA